MADHPVILTIRFLLELGALAAYGYWGWTQHEGVARVALGVGLPVLAAVLWGVFRVPGHPGDAPIAVSGPVRLLLEFAIFGGAAAVLWLADQRTIAAVFGLLVVLHYAASYDYILELLGRR